MAKPLNNGRDKPRYTCIFFNLLESDAWKSLPGPACKIFLELRRRFNGHNNGDISLSCREAADIALCGKSNALRHFQSLVDHGLIALHNKGVMGNRHASTWYLTMERCIYNNAYPTNRWRDFKSAPPLSSKKTKSAVLIEERSVPVIEL